MPPAGQARQGTAAGRACAAPAPRQCRPGARRMREQYPPKHPDRWMRSPDHGGTTPADGWRELPPTSLCGVRVRERRAHGPLKPRSAETTTTGWTRGRPYPRPALPTARVTSRPALPAAGITSGRLGTRPRRATGLPGCAGLVRKASPDPLRKAWPASKGDQPARRRAQPCTDPAPAPIRPGQAPAGYSPDARGSETRCQPFRKLRTSVSL